MKKVKVSLFKRRFVIYPKFQYSLVGFFVAATLVNALFFFITVNSFLEAIKSNLKSLNLSTSNPFFSFISTQQVTINIVLGVVTLLGVTATFWGGLWISNKVAGPLHRILRIMKRCDDHKNYATKIELRKGDYFNDVRDGINAHFEIVDREIKNRERAA